MFGGNPFSGFKGGDALSQLGLGLRSGVGCLEPRLKGLVWRTQQGTLHRVGINGVMERAVGKGRVQARVKVDFTVESG